MVPVLVGPVTYLLLSKPAKGVEKSFSLLSLLDSILPIYKEVITELKAAGASWIQFDEPTLVKDLEVHELDAFTKAYADLESTLSGLNVLVQTYVTDVTPAAYKTLTSLKGVTGFGSDLVRGSQTLELIKSGFPSGKYLFAGVVDGRNIWANDLAASVSLLESLEATVGKDKLVVSTSSSLLHTAVDLINETKPDNEIKSWLAFAAQKVVEVNALAKALAGQKDEAFFSANAVARASRKSSPRVNNELRRYLPVDLAEGVLRALCLQALGQVGRYSYEFLSFQCGTNPPLLHQCDLVLRHSIRILRSSYCRTGNIWSHLQSLRGIKYLYKYNVFQIAFIALAGLTFVFYAVFSTVGGGGGSGLGSLLLESLSVDYGKKSKLVRDEEVFARKVPKRTETLLVTALMAATLSTLMCYPLDTMRRQMQMKGTPYKTLLDAFQVVVESILHLFLFAFVSSTYKYQ